MAESCNNVGHHLPEMAARFPYKTALAYPDGRDRASRVTYSQLTFSQLEELSNRYASAFRESGIGKDTRVLMLVKPSLEFIALGFAVFKTGATPVFIDPGMGKDNLLDCIKKTEPEAMVAISRAHWISKIFPGAFKTVKTRFSLGGFPPPGCQRLEKLDYASPAPEFPALAMELDDPAAIVFTTGSTGPPKGVVYTHRIFNTQIKVIGEGFGAGPEEVDMSGFPLFAMFAVALGMTSVIPDMDFTRPAEVDPVKILEAVNNHGVSFSFGSPALWRKVATYCIDNKIVLPSLKRVLMAGAPVNAELHDMVKRIIHQDGETLVPYGATESMPIAAFNGTEMLGETAALSSQGKGYCVGYPLPPMEIKIMHPSDTPVPEWNDDLELPAGTVGEIVVKGPVVTREYFLKPEATAAAKITGTDGKVIHRIGDMGYFDTKGRLWFCGRKNHVVKTSSRILYPVCCEAIFNTHPQVFRTALVGVGDSTGQRPVIVIEMIPEANYDPKKIIEELRQLGQDYDFTAEIKDFIFHPGFPVDIRHNVKIFREKLAVWVKSRLKN